MESYTDYMMLIAPPKNVMYDIGRYKRASARVIGDFPGLNSPAHITINQKHRCKPYDARHGISQIGDKLGLLTPANLQVSNFKYFDHGPSGFTIYACVIMNEATQRWFKGLQAAMGVINKTSIPHITVVKNLSPDNFRILWPKFQACKFQCSFWAEKLTVLERETYAEKARWAIYKEFKFGEKLMQY